MFMLQHQKGGIGTITANDLGRTLYCRDSKTVLQKKISAHNTLPDLLTPPHACG